MAVRIVIARHGNTFRPGEVPTRVGAATDLPLVEKQRGKSIGLYLADEGMIPDAVYAAPLLRTMQTAELAIEAMGVQREIIPMESMREISYGPDENKPEDVVELRLGNGDREKGKAVIAKWNESAVVPQGWDVEPQQLIYSWLDFARMVEEEQTDGSVVLVVSSNGIIRFAPYLTGNFEDFAACHDIKVATGGVCIFEKEKGEKFWNCLQWNVKPYKMY